MEITRNPTDDFVPKCFRDSLSILKTSIGLSRGGKSEFYKVAAAQLRLLLCDTTRRHERVEDISLVRMIYPDFQLFAPGEGFLEENNLLPLSDWLDLPIPEKEGSLAETIRLLIRRVCDSQGGVHIDPKKIPAKTMEFWDREWILRIGESVVEQLEEVDRGLKLKPGCDECTAG